jgi:IS5 family transposase
MLKRPQHQNQLNLFSSLADQLDQKHPLYRLANEINWQVFEDSFSKYYSEKMGKPSKPIRLMVSLLILKYLRNLSDENVVEHWSENLYFQYFSGESQFRAGLPCVPTELVMFRQRIGPQGVELILQESIKINRGEDDDQMGNTISIDTTVQEKNISYPTDNKLIKKIISKCNKIFEETGTKPRQTYARVLKKLSNDQRFRRKKSGHKKAVKADKKVRTIAGRFIRELRRKLNGEQYEKYKYELEMYQKVLDQKRGDTNKIYSLHEPTVKCYAKGKEHKKFEFGSKASIIVDQKSGVIMGAVNFSQTLHDSKTIPLALDQFERLNGKGAKEAYVDRGYRGITQYKTTEIKVPDSKRNISKTQRKKHSRRAAIEPVIGHLKQDYRLVRNYLKGEVGDWINLMLAAAAMNFKRRMNLWRTEAQFGWKLICESFAFVIDILCSNFKLTF